MVRGNPFRRQGVGKKPPDKPSSISRDISDATLLMLTQLKESADFFPPLKSAVGGVLSIYQLSQTVKSNKKDARQLAKRAVELIEILERATNASTNISTDLRDSIHKFNVSLHYIHNVMARLAAQKKVERWLRMNDHKDELMRCNNMLDDAARVFTLASNIRVEISLQRLESKVETKLDLITFERRQTERNLEFSPTLVFLG
ncbi:hypothetical protein BD410DRAFT_135240 [Rickenella mellea]|uniref:Mixed lineage kinase domain-containing protein n=1 Tax=Rickenella mellea TaxID=50990 RepID=A0A4Y7PI77_9AGAM|nr:hypothetical protein BD410DRAFT_135240 [Rickenella mellea]